MRLRWNTNGDHLYMLLDIGFMFKYKTYSIKSQDDKLEE